MTGLPSITTSSTEEHCAHAAAQVLEAAGIRSPRALAVVYTARARSVAAVRGLREGANAFPPFCPHGAPHLM